MTAINHALTGAIIGLVVGQPLVAVPAAVGSHFVCDALPHFDFNIDVPEEVKLKTKKFQNYLIAEASLCALVVILLAVFHPQHWLLAAVCAFAAAAPDLLSINRYLTIRRGRHWQPGRYAKFANGIQWFERPVGAIVEAAWFVAALIIIVPFLR